MKMSRAVLAVGLVLGLSGAAWAGTPAAGLGQAWPNTTDLSRSPHYHVYSFTQGGVRYIQVNALDGTVLGAVGTVGGEFIVLPMGNAARVATPQQPAAGSDAATPAAAPTPVYRDSSTTITATPMSDGSTQLQATPAVTTDVCDAVTCSTHGA
ncbi:hypothetical protein [Dyella acidiphila]|uniref:Uncharacterized protein n=1 Tax=Dyella acidiphila TaxID=2775866 RepID=A0ABR9GEP8_9GAMM|nr:hypothetical protein [Dyella acidiphila]MBE1162508.1 hypothetical protein [Dyella acidiphila]